MSDESDSEEHYYSGSEEGDESHGSDSDDGNHGLLDLEASEGSSDPDIDADQISHDGSYAEYSFPQFMQLPPEIREMVWAAFCPDLASGPRVLELHLHTVVSPPGAVHLPDVVHGIIAGPQLESQTALMGDLMAVHRETRALGLKAAPHEFTLSRGEVVRYHEGRDVLFVWWEDEILLRGIALRFQELGIDAQNLAFPSNLVHLYGDDLVDFMYLLPQTRRVFILDEDDLLYNDEEDYDWVVAETIHRYHLDTEEEGEAGLVDPVSRITCWPDLDNHRGFAEEKVTKTEDCQWWRTTILDCRRRLEAPLENSRELNDDDLSDEEKTEAVRRLQSIEVWPMIRFSFEDSVDHFYEIKENKRVGRLTNVRAMALSLPYDIDPYGDNWIDDDSLPDYDPRDDSPSIDGEDTTIAQNLAQRIFGRSHGDPHGSSSQSLDDSSEIDSEIDDSSGIGELPPANFSSDEEVEDQDHATINSDSEDESGSQTRTTRPKRRVVASDSDESATETEQSPVPSKQRSRAAISDSEDDDGEGPSDLQPARGANRRARAIPIDSEDEDEHGSDDAPQPSRAGRRRGRAVPVDSDDDDDEAEEQVQQPSGAKKTRRRVVQEGSDEEDGDGKSDSQDGGAKMKNPGSSDSEEQSSSDDEDDDPPPPKRMSLAQRLRMESRQARPRHVNHDDSGADDMNGDGDGYSDDQEDEVDKSDSDIMAALAGSMEGEDGESEEEY